MADNEVLAAIMGADDYEALKKPLDTSGYYNLQLLQKALNSIKPVSNQAARVILYQSEIALDKAYSKVHTILPGKTSAEAKAVPEIEKIRGHLNWHRERIGKNDKELYEFGDDLKKWSSLSFIEFNSALQGSITEGDRSFFKEAVEALADLLKKGKKLVESGTSYIAWGLGLGAVGLGAYALYQYKMAKIKHGSKSDD